MKKLVILLLLATSLNGLSQVIMSGSGSYSQNFDALATSGSSNTWIDNSTIANFYSQRTSTSSSYTGNDGSFNSGGLYSYGTVGSNERAIGSIGSSNLTFGGSFAHGILLQNTSNNSINTLNVSYKLEQWRNGGNTNPNTITFWYQVSTNAITGLTPGSNTGWIAVTGLNTTSPINTSTSGALDGNNPTNQIVLSNVAIPNLSIPSGSFIMLRWLDVDHTGTDHGLAVDDVTLNWTVCASPLTYYLDSDGDTFGNPNSSIQACSSPIGYVTNDSDCNDASALINPNTVWYADTDGDTYGNLNSTFTGCTPPIGFVLNTTDCNDNNNTVDALSTWYQDSDQDGFGNSAVSISSCGQPSGYVSDSTDCNDNNNNVNALSIWYQDLDGDGSGNPNVSILNCGQPSGYVSNNSDCNDNANDISPAAPEIADNIDNDCDGLVDEGFALLTWYLDSDLDGFGGSTSTQSVQSPGPNYILQGGDCNDTINSINPNAQEICDGLDNNCDGQVDNGLTFTTYYADVDGDTYGNPNSSVSACSQPTGFVLNNTDCNDSIAAINPGAIDIPINGIDEDCNGSDAPLLPITLGMYQFAGTIDCNTQDNAVTTQPNGATFSLFNSLGTTCAAGGGVFNRSGWNSGTSIDLTEYNEFTVAANDCKKLNLDRVAFKYRQSSQAGSPIWHLRSSVDNFASDLDSGSGAFVSNTFYYDDTVFLTNHTNLDQVTFRFYITEILGTSTTWRMDDVSLYGNILSLTPQTYYADNDGDGFGDATINSLTCSTPVGYVLDNTDCNDQDSLISPNTIWYLDSDNDQIGDSTISFTGCIPPIGYVLIAGDCDNSNPLISGPTTYFIDADGDGFGADSTAQTFCQNPGVGYVTAGGDCNDNDTLINPNAIEICDGVDNDCDGLIDNGLVFNMYYVDADGDGFGDEVTGVESCSQPQNTITIGGDCDDTNDQIYPGATEICDAVDNDCDGSIDEGLNFITYYTDADNDGFGTGSTGIGLCEVPGPGFSTNNLDCNDNNNEINPNATDTLNNGIDENCDGVDGYLYIQEISKLSLIVSPNPNNGLFLIQLNQKVSNGEIKLMDLNGKVIGIYNVNGDSIQITENTIEKGVYILHVSIEGNQLIERLIVQ